VLRVGTLAFVLAFAACGDGGGGGGAGSVFCQTWRAYVDSELPDYEAAERARRAAPDQLKDDYRVLYEFYPIDPDDLPTPEEGDDAEEAEDNILRYIRGRCGVETELISPYYPARDE